MKYLPFFISLTLLSLSGCNEKSSQTYQGYAEGEYVNISSTQSGKLEKLFVKRGDTISKNTNLFLLDHANESLAFEQASSELAIAQATLDDYQKGSRPEEIHVLEAQLTQAKAASENASLQLAQNTRLYNSNAISKVEFDTTTALSLSTAAKVKELQNTLTVAKLSKRNDQIIAQKNRLKQLQAALDLAQWRVTEKALKSPKGALVFDTLYREGEFVPVGGIIVRLLPPENIKIRFFVPQAIIEKLAIHQPITITSRADHKKIPARITYISPEAEYTPPIIYSNETKDKLIYMIEAYPDRQYAALLHPGQPVEVSFE
ncbi:MAG: HlyD family efflux transporter periplasmic adaptor subunit [Sulfuricurvum sp.]|uniref:HlyD family secretion protein n=1 Tax=Sulfuricurvum sp. TaxID=2025608 RepID=UPI0026149994|nr:HlyD family efflux transporter periplasmic adaptor subunit [Sulfuricurvum sp.]MDD2829259.1 HlyD family efflux transporter periplasmic adaptor subunit [Sulfuricurvum sp.]MDD4949977.1 HlyD family efflux transporter periplasmic adaptor subunit [Sulfuricurvum sp.]